MYGGRFVDNSLPEEILVLEPLEPRNSWLAAVPYAQVLHRADGWYQWETEEQLAKHFGEQDHWETNAPFVFRWLRFPWSNPRTSLAVGDGLSYAFRDPRLSSSGAR